MQIGIVGKPSCGKSTLFKAATLAEVDIANYPFTTIKPNHAVGFVRKDCVDSFFETQCHPRFGYCKEHQRFIPVDMIDVAGLVPDAHKGEGMGAQFLNDLNQADVLIHVIDVSGSTNEKGEPVTALEYDPANDIRFLEKELDHWYEDIIKRGWDRFARQIQQEKKEIKKALAKQLSGIGVDEVLAEAAIKKLGLDPFKPTVWTDEDIFNVAKELRKKTKPMIIAANKADVPGADKNVERLKKEFPDYHIVPCSSESELVLKQADKSEIIDYIPGDDNFKILDEGKLNDKQKAALGFIKENVLDRFGSTGVQDVLNAAVFDVLKMITIYPGGASKLEDSDGNVLPDCFLLPEGSTALDFAFKLHTDFGKHFIRAIDVKKRQTVGKDYELHDADVIEIIHDK